MAKLFRFRTSLSFEFERDAPLTVRDEFVREDYEDAFKSAVRSAVSQHARATGRASSMVVCVEKLAEVPTPTGGQLTETDS